MMEDENLMGKMDGKDIKGRGNKNKSEQCEPSNKKQRSIDKVCSSESIAEHAQAIIDEIDVKRKNDETLISEFRKMMEHETDVFCGILQQSLGKLYEKSNDACQVKLQKLYEILGRISHLEQEMFAFKESLKVLYAEVEPEH